MLKAADGNSSHAVSITNVPMHGPMGHQCPRHCACHVIEVIQRQNSVQCISVERIWHSSVVTVTATRLSRLASPPRSTNQVHTASIPWIQSFNRGIRSALSGLSCQIVIR